MSEAPRGSENSPSVEQGASQYRVELPCSPETFTTFISGLLGKPQTIEQRIVGPFELTKSDVENVFHLVNQRIRQQNEATLIQFNIKIIYDDGSSVLLNSLEDFLVYSEVRPVISLTALLSWTYLIKFKDKVAPEKQEIELSFMAGHHGTLVLEDDELVPYRPVFGGNTAFGMVLLRIRHTARTWGVDLESLLTGHVKGLLKEEPKWKRLSYRYSGTIGIVVGLLFFLMVLIGVFISTNKFVEIQMQTAQNLLSGPANSLVDVSSKLDFVIRRAATADWARFVFASTIFVVLSGILSFVFGGWAATAAENRLASFVLLSKKAEDNKNELLRKRHRRLLSFIASIFSSVASGLVSRVLFATAFERWLR